MSESNDVKRIKAHHTQYRKRAEERDRKASIEIDQLMKATAEVNRLRMVLLRVADMLDNERHAWLQGADPLADRLRREAEGP